MNLPNSLALSPSKLFQSRLGILLLTLAVVVIGAGVYLLAMNRERPAVLPSPGTSPAAQALPRPGTLPGNPPGHPLMAPNAWVGPPAPLSALTPVPTASPNVVYGPPAPDWAVQKPAPVAGTPPPAPVATTVPGTPAPTASAPAPAATAPAPTAVGAAPEARTATAAAPATGAATQAATAVPAPAAAVPIAPSTAADLPKSIDASVLFAREQFTYASDGRRDPFQSLIDGKFQGHVLESGLVDVGDIHLVGIMWGSSDKFALVEDSRGHGYVLRVGDPVLNGYISGITKTDLQIVQNAFGDSQSLSIHLQPKEGDKNANRN